MIEPLLPRLAKKPFGEFFKPIDGILLCQVDTLTTLAYLIAISTLFESTEQALAVLENSSPAELENASNTLVAGHWHPKLYQAVTAFYLEEQSLTESADQFGIPLQQLESLARNAGVGFVKTLTMTRTNIG
ncbi:hypothetical protein HZU75_13910 [Chitinibacter fontanus]|uniref:Uncharacterized protein n=1 Tax=Chitinibacter fontanus TaxID=1737446 RepID=A0A7D5VBZ0_9NEIS|nr:hypothetical protein [Chitinibacter fontanus]QLI82533.1 hypothetical protein HZU75_13910 [Chitinibacter fontanus]